MRTPDLHPSHDKGLTLIQKTVGEGIAAVTRKTSETIGYPVCVLDAAYRPAAEHGGHGTHEKASANADSWAAHLHSFLSFRPKLPAYIAGPQSGTRSAVFPARNSRGDTLGYLIASSIPEPVTADVESLLEAAALAAAAALAREQLVERTRLELEGDFFERLLSSDQHRVDDLLAQARVLGVELSEFYWPCLVDWGDSDEPFSSWKTQVQRDVFPVPAPVHTGMNRGACYVLVPDSGIGVQKRHVLSRALSEFLDRCRRRSRPSPFALHTRHSVGVGQVGREWNRLLSTQQVVRALDRVEGVHDVEEFVLPQFLLEAFRAERAAEFIDKTIGSVLDYDRLNGTRLLRTLELYLDSGCSLSATARAARYHRNTVSRQLARLRDVLGMPLDGSLDRLSLQLAIKLHRLR